MGFLGEERIRDLSNANGTFALCFYDTRRARLILAADSIGARPLYYAISAGRLLFSTSLEVLTRLGLLSAPCDLAAYIEEEAMYYPLGARTMYKGIRVLTASQAILASRDGFSTHEYHDWSTIPAATESIDDLAIECRRALRDAVACRAMQGKRQTSLLSGGLDSRVLVAELLDLGCDVDAVNLAPGGCQDSVYAARFAEAAKIALRSKPWVEQPSLSASECTAMLLSTAVSGYAPGTVFSGDGGGETFGFLCINAKAGELLNRGRPTAAVNEFLSNYHVSSHLFKADSYSVLKTVAQDRMEAELNRIGTAQGEKALHIFVIVNDMRCHLHGYFNRLTKTKVELLLPFYDRRVIASVLRIPAPIAPLMEHAFYHHIVKLLPPVVCAVPWQTYPGRLPCPVKDEAPPPNQWSRRKTHIGNMLARRCLRLAFSRSFAPVLRRGVVVAAAMRHLARLGDYTYLFKTCINVQARCGQGCSWVLREDETSSRAVRSVGGAM
jgi:asparagine synthase (glutamine-hydrolysing)